MRGFFSFRFSTKNINPATHHEQRITPCITATDIIRTQEPRNLTPTKQNTHLKKMEERNRHLRTMYFSS